MNNQTPLCPECGHITVREIRPFEVKYQGLSETVDHPGFYCTNCAEAIFIGKDMADADRALHRLKAKYEGLLSSDEIRKIRQKLQLSQADASLVLGGGPNSFHKYETDKGLPSKAICNVLRLLDANPSMLEILQKDKRKENINALSLRKTQRSKTKRPSTLAEC